MGSKPLTPALVVPKEPMSTRQAIMQAYKEQRSIDKHPADPEKIEMGKSEDRAKPLDINHYRIVNEVWHFCSVDWGSKCKALPTTKSPLLSQCRSVYWLQYSS